MNRFAPHRSQQLEARLRHLETTLARRLALLGEIAVERADQASNIGSLSGGPALVALDGDVTGTSAESLVERAQGVELPVPTGADDGKILAYDAGTNTYMLVYPTAVSGQVIVDGVVYTIQHADINATALGDNVILAPVVARSLRVLAVTFTASASVAVAWKASGGSTLIEAMSFAGNGGMDVNRYQGKVAETPLGEGLDFNLSVAANVRGSLDYIELE